MYLLCSHFIATTEAFFNVSNLILKDNLSSNKSKFAFEENKFVCPKEKLMTYLRFIR